MQGKVNYRLMCKWAMQNNWSMQNIRKTLNSSWWLEGSGKYLPQNRYLSVIMISIGADFSPVIHSGISRVSSCWGVPRSCLLTDPCVIREQIGGGRRKGQSSYQRLRGIISSVSLLNQSYPLSNQQNSINFYELFSHAEVLDSINICVSACFVQGI